MKTTETTAVEPVTQPGPLQVFGSMVPDYIKTGDSRGTENITSKDIKFPALRLAQAMSPETKRSDAKYIEGLLEGMLFNSVTKEIYGDDPISFVVINMLGHRNVEFDPNDRNVVLDGDVADDDPRCQFTVENGERKKPKATKFYDYLILVIREGQDPELMTLSFKSTQLKKAVDMNSTLAKTKGKLPSFAHLFRASVVDEKKGQNSWKGWKITRTGWPPAAVYELASKSYDKFADKVDRANLETADDSGPKDDDIPF